MAQAPTFIVIAHYYFIYLLPESIYLYPLLRSILPIGISFGSLFISFDVAVFSFYLHVLIYLAQQTPALDNYQTIRDHITSQFCHDVLPDSRTLFNLPLPLL